MVTRRLQMIIIIINLKITYKHNFYIVRTWDRTGKCKTGPDRTSAIYQNNKIISIYLD